MKNLQHLFFFTVVTGVASIVISGAAQADTVYVSNSGNDTIAIISSSGTTTFDSGLDDPQGLAFNSSGNLFVANAGSGDISEFSPSGGLITGTYATGLDDPTGIAFDSAGNLYVANSGSNDIVKILAGGGSSSVFATDSSTPYGLAFNAGNLYVTNNSSNSIIEISAGPTESPVPVSGQALNIPDGIAFDKNGNIFVVNHGAPSIEEISGGNGTIFANDASLSLPRDLAFDYEGNLYVTDSGNNTVTEYTSSGTVTFSTDLSKPSFVAVTSSCDSMAVPEPSTYALLTAGMGVLFFLVRRKAARA